MPTCSASRSVQHPPVGRLHRPCGREALLTTLPTRRFSWRTTGSALASPCLLSLRFCRQPERGAVLQRQQRVPHCLLQCDEPSLHRAHRDCCKKEQSEAPCRLTERGACGAADRADALLRWSVDPEGRGPAREGGQGVTQLAVWRLDLHGWSGHDDAGSGWRASWVRVFVLFCWCGSTAIRSVCKVKRRSGTWWLSAVWRVCWRDEEKLLVNKRQMMCVLGLMVRKERITVIYDTKITAIVC